MRRLRRRPPRRIAIDASAFSRAWFTVAWQSWLMGQTPISELLAAIDRRTMRGHVGVELVEVAIPAAYVPALKSRIAQRIHQAGGVYRTDDLVVRSADGVTFTVSLP